MRPAPEAATPIRRARKAKLLPHRCFPDAEITVWVDGSFEPLSDIEALVGRFLAVHDLAMFDHFQRDCVYDEAEACIELGKDDPALIRSQVARYRAAGYPARNGLFASGVLLRRHTPQLREFCERWWTELETGSHRDQLALPYVLHRTGVSHERLGENQRASEWFRHHPHGT